jgi:hypothetical protein
MKLDMYVSRIKRDKIKHFPWVGLVYYERWQYEHQTATFGRLDKIPDQTEDPRGEFSLNFTEGMRVDYVFQRDYDRPDKVYMSSLLEARVLLEKGEIYDEHEEFASKVRRLAKKETDELKKFLELSKVLYQNPNLRSLPQQAT